MVAKEVKKDSQGISLSSDMKMEKIMSVLVSILTFLDGRMETPTNYGIWHICFLLLTIGATVLMTVLFRNASDRTMRRVLTVMWVIFLALEVYKHIVFSFSVEDGRIVFDYPWYIFPFQFCSTPFYALPFLIFLKDGPVRNFFAMFTTGFVLFAGLAVMLYPNDVFTTRTGVNIQTMVHHGMQVVMGVMLVAYNRRRMTLRNLGGGIAVFALFAATAMTLNELAYIFFTANGLDDTFNMFFISRHFPCTLPILSTVYELVPYPVFLLIYLLGFALVSALLFGIEKGILALVMRKKHDTK